MIAFFISQNIMAGGAARPHVVTPAARPLAVQAPVLRRAVHLNHFAERSMNFGPGDIKFVVSSNLRDQIITALQNDGAITVIDDPARIENSSALGESALSASSVFPPDPIRVPTEWRPLMRLDLRTTALSLALGEKANREYFGFDDSLNPQGFDSSVDNLSPMGRDALSRSFSQSTDLHIGKDLGSELNLDLIWLGAKVKWLAMNALLKVNVRGVYTFLGNQSAAFEKIVETRGTGKVLDLGVSINTGLFTVGTLPGSISVEVNLARRDALTQAFLKMAPEFSKEVAKEIVKTPVLTGFYEGYVAAGALSHSLRTGIFALNLDAILRRENDVSSFHEVAQLYTSTSELECRGNCASYRTGDRIFLHESREVLQAWMTENLRNFSLSTQSTLQASSVNGSGAVSNAAVSAQTPATSVVNVAIPEINPAQVVLRFLESTAVRMARGLAQAATLAYRLARYNQYDQPYFTPEGEGPMGVEPIRAQALARTSWAHERIGTVRAWSEIGLGSESVKVAILDTGMDYNHRELKHNLFWSRLTNTPGFDFFSMDPRPFDDHEHGTEIASLIAGGGWRMVGVAPYSKILPLKIFSGYGDFSSRAVLSGVAYALRENAQVIVFPWSLNARAGGETKRISDLLTTEVVKILRARQNLPLIVMAAGDEGLPLHAPEDHALFPMTLRQAFPESTLIVGGADPWGLPVHERKIEYELVTQDDYFRTITPSNFGSGVDIFAPGGPIMVASPRNSYNEEYRSSTATAFVAGAAALLLSSSRNPPTAAQVRIALLSGALGSELKELYLPTAISALRLGY